MIGRRYMWLCLLVLLASCSAADPDTVCDRVDVEDVPGISGEAPMQGRSVVFYNVENLFDTEDDRSTNDNDFLPGTSMDWTEDRLRTKLEHLSAAIAMTGNELPAMVGLAEVENAKVVKALADQSSLKKGNYAVVHYDSPDERGIDVALLFNSEILALVKSEPLNIPLDKDRTRDILHAELSAKGHVYHVFVNHWSSRREGQEKSEPKRMVAARVLKDAVDRIETGPTVHILIMGDFNDTPNDNSIQKGLGARCDLKTSSLVDLMCIDQPHGTGSYPYKGEWQYLDQFIVDPGTAGSVVSAKAFRDDRIMFKHPRYGPSPDKTYSGGHYKGGYSDHLPIVLRFK